MKKNILKHVPVAMTFVVSWIALLSTGCPSATSTSLLYNDKNAKAIGEEFEFGGGGGGVVVDAAKFPPDWQPKWGTLKGVIKVSGSVNGLSRIATPKEPNICGATYPDQRYEISSSGGLKNVIIFLNDSLPKLEDGKSKWIHERYDFAKVEASGADPNTLLPQQKRELLFDQKQCIFLSHAFAMRTDQLMRIKNSDNTFHNTNLAPKKNSGANMGIGAFGGDSYQPKKEEVEPFSVSCSAHPWMAAWAIFRDSPYFAVTNEEGEFEIPDVPAGVALEFRVWQENLKWVSPSAVNNAASDWNRGKFTITLEEGKAAEIEVTIDGGSFKAG